jgi:nucleotide-binding universal stress UspA family protein
VTGPVVVGYDASEAAEAALERAIAEAESSGGKLVVVAVAELTLEPQGSMVFGGAVGEAPMPTVPVVEPPEITHVLEVARDRVEPTGLSAEYVWDAGDAAGAILREAQERSAALIVVGKTHHSRLGRWLGADTGAEVERAAGCPVLLVEA